MASSWMAVEQEQEPQPEEPEERATQCARCRKSFACDEIPWQDFCSHRFCDDCFKGLSYRHSHCPACWRKGESYKVASDLHFPDKSFLRMKDLKAKCSFDPPCGWVGEFTQLSDHEGRCENRKWSCFNCGSRVLWRQMKHHVTSECRRRIVTCHHCQLETTYSAIIEHERTDCPFYHRALLQHLSNHKDDVLKGIWMLQKAVYQRLDAQRHLSNLENSTLMATVNGNNVGDDRPECLQLADEFQRTRVQLEDLKSNLEDLVRRADSVDSKSRLNVNQFREEIERLNEECIKLASVIDLETVQGEGSVAVFGGFGKVQTSGGNELENSKNEGCETNVGKEVQKAGKKKETEFGLLKQDKRNSTLGGGGLVDPGELLEMERKEYSDVGEEEIKMESSFGHRSEEPDEKLATEQNDLKRDVSSELGDFAGERKTQVPMNDEIKGQRVKGNVEFTHNMENKLKEVVRGDDKSDHEKSEGKTGKWNQENRRDERNQITKSDDRPGSNLSFCQNVSEKEPCSKGNDSFYHSGRPNKHYSDNDQAINRAANESTEPSLQETKRKKNKKKNKKSIDQDVSKNVIDSKIVDLNILHSQELCYSKMNACQEKVDVLERAMEVLVREMERLAKSNSLLLKLMRDQQNLEGRVSAIEETRQKTETIDDGY